MGIIRSRRRPVQDTYARERLAARELEIGQLGRCEAQAFAAPTRKVDPYTAWLELREEERERQRPEIRWVYRHQGTSAKTTVEGHGPDADGALAVTA